MTCTVAQAYWRDGVRKLAERHGGVKVLLDARRVLGGGEIEGSVFDEFSPVIANTYASVALTELATCTVQVVNYHINTAWCEDTERSGRSLGVVYVGDRVNGKSLLEFIDDHLCQEPSIVSGSIETGRTFTAGRQVFSSKRLRWVGERGNMMDLRGRGATLACWITVELLVGFATASEMEAVWALPETAPMLGRGQSSVGQVLDLSGAGCFQSVARHGGYSKGVELLRTWSTSEVLYRR